MPIRTGTQALIGRVRLLMGDPAGTSQVFTDDQVQDALDQERTDVLQWSWRELVPDWPWGGGSAVDFYDPGGWGDWETDTTVRDAGGNILSPALADLLTGHWQFSQPTAAPLFVSGKTYDVYASAHALVIAWIAIEATRFDFSAVRGTSFQPSQKRAGLLMLADQLATMMRPRTTRLVRRDVYGR